MPRPDEVFKDPGAYWSFLTAPDDSTFEGQHFDRKEVVRPEDGARPSPSQVSNLRDHVKKAVSAFANSNHDGGLLVLGITKTGVVSGTLPLTEEQRNSLTNLDGMLVNQAAQVSFFDHESDDGRPNQIILIYVPRALHGICETLGPTPDGWRRVGPQSLPLTHAQRDQLRRERNFVDFENGNCCPYDSSALDRGVLDEFRQVALEGARYERSDQELLHDIGALNRIGGEFWFTNAGYLFFAANPQRMMAWAHLRLLRFERTVQDDNRRVLPTFDQSFDGPITKQIRKFRDFAQGSAFFKTYQRRNEAGGGFIDEPELPAVAVDEAIVNAVAHRDYAMRLPIRAELYRDAFVVTNPGRIIQHDRDVPREFTLDNLTLSSVPPNSKLMEWLRKMRDPRGAAFVRALSEGTRRMYDEMAALRLEPPLFIVSDSQTRLVLRSDAPRREAQFLAQAEPSTEFANLYPLGELAVDPDADTSTTVFDEHRQEFMEQFSSRLSATGWYVDRASHGRIQAHRRGSPFEVSTGVSSVVRFYPAYTFQHRRYWGRHYLCIDYGLVVQNVLSARDLLRNLTWESLIGRAATVQWKGWERGRIISVNDQWCRVRLFDFDQEVEVPNDRVIPDLPVRQIETVLDQRSIKHDVHRTIREFSLASQPAASRLRVDRIQAVATILSEELFPLRVAGVQISLQATPAALVRGQNAPGGLRAQALREPPVEFNHHQETPNIREGITKFGSYESSPKTVELVPICLDNMRTQMRALIDRLRLGKFQYRGSERTFSTRLTYGTITTASQPSEIESECSRLLSEHPEWKGDDSLSRIFLVHTPEQGYASDDESSPYYRVKRILLESGIPCQMVDTPTLINPDWKDLNLSLNIFAKCGATPWVLSNAMPDADFFVGLSYTQSHNGTNSRYIGYANVFNNYGRWLYYSGSYKAFSYEDRVQNFAELTKRAMEGVQLTESPSVHFHYSARFSREDRRAILEAAQRVRPNGTYSFVWINTHHPVRFFDSRPEGDGSLRRGNYIAASADKFYLSTTGYNQYRKMLGAPHPLEVSVQVERATGMPPSRPDLRTIAIQVLSLTKLNWASTDSLCAEPITTKYAGNIAYLTDAFLRQGTPFRLHPILEKTPWFL